MFLDRGALANWLPQRPKALSSTEKVWKQIRQPYPKPTSARDKELGGFQLNIYTGTR